jgi:hypothetical protein
MSKIKLFESKKFVPSGTKPGKNGIFRWLMSSKR